MILKFLTVGPMQVNCYVVADEDTREAVIIDPGADPEVIQGYIAGEGLTPRCIINTHGHADHIGANRFFNLPVWIHELDKEFLTDPKKNLSASFGAGITSPEAARLIGEGDEIKVGNASLVVVHTPGHTPGSISLKAGNIIFTGDTLFCEGMGRTDLPAASEKDILESIAGRILTLPDDTLVYPGHGPASSVGHEKKHNPFL